jgi:hypothetical protein
LNGFNYFTVRYILAIENAITNLNLSSLSERVAACFRKIGANPYQSQIRSNKLLGSKILTGKDIPITL